MQFPVIVKPRVASYVPHAHWMVIARDKESLLRSALPNPDFSFLLTDTMVVQAFVVDHSETLLKYYTIGRHSDFRAKPSFPDAFVKQHLDQDGYLLITNKTKSDIPFQPRDRDSLVTADMRRQLEILNRFMNEHVKIGLVGLDLCIDAKSNQLFLIDCNYLASYDGVFNDCSNICTLILEDIVAKASLSKA